MRAYLLYDADIILDSPHHYREASGNLHHRMAGHNSVVISPHPGLDHVLWPQNLNEA